MTKKIILFFFLPLQMVFGQEQVSLTDCYQWARENYPNLKQTEIWSEISNLNQENIKINWLPSVSLNAQATYQSDVPGIEIPLPNISIPTVSKDQYKAYAEFKQTIWDGGLTAAQAKIEEAALKTNLSKVEVELYQLKEQISQAFFTTLVVEKQIGVINAQKKILTEKLKSLDSGIKNGVVEPSAALVLKAEILNIEQSEVQLHAGKTAAINVLSVLTGKTIDDNSKFVYNASGMLNSEINRIEFQLFNNQSKQLETQLELLDKTRNPKLFGFGQAGFGNPGLNLLNDGFDTYYLLGVGISWNAFDWKNTSRKKRIIQLNQQMIQSQRQTFTQNIKMLLAQQSAQISKLKSMLKNDELLINLRTRITKAAASKLENDMITTTDYTRELQTETSAKINYELHKLQLDQAREKYKLLAGE